MLMTNALVLILIFFFIFEQPSNAAKTKETKNSKYSNICGRKYPSLNSRGFKIFDTVRKFSSIPSLEHKTSPQHKALCWLIHEDKSGYSTSTGKIKERFALASLWFATSPEKWNTSTNWLSKESVCYWYGITCDGWGYVTAVDLGFNGLLGLIPSEIGLLLYLQELRLTANDLQGVIPNSIGHLSNLKVLELNMNGFFGVIPSTIGKLGNLRELHLYGNYFDGTLPTELGNMRYLENLDIYANYLKGNLPTELSNVKYLKHIFLNDNEFRGTIPSDICDMKSLEFFIADCLGHYPEITCKCCTHCCQETHCEEMQKKPKQIK